MRQAFVERLLCPLGVPGEEQMGVRRRQGGEPSVHGASALPLRKCLLVPPLLPEGTADDIHCD